MKYKYLFIITAILAFIISTKTLFPDEIKGPLETLSKIPGEHIEKIKNLGENEWLSLGTPKADPKWGVARGRAWSPKMVYAENLNAAFFCATGQHGYVKSDGHYMDDLWAYDVNANAWICLHPGASKKTKLKLNEHGFEVTEDGDYHPISYCSHGYNNMTYIPETKEYMLTYRACPWWVKAIPQRAEWLGVPEDKRSSGYNYGNLNTSARHPLFYSALKGKWERRFVEDTKAVSNSSQMGVLEYIPFKKKVFYLHTNYVAYYDPASNLWEKVPNSKTNLTYDINGCFDQKRKRMIIPRGSFFKAYDLENETWVDLKSENQPQKLPTCIAGTILFDDKNDSVLVFNKTSKTNGHLSLYNCDTGIWSEKEIKWPEGFKSTYKLSHGFYHKELNAHFFYLAGDSDDKDATMMVYRIK